MPVTLSIVSLQPMYESGKMLCHFFSYSSYRFNCWESSGSRHEIVSTNFMHLKWLIEDLEGMSDLCMYKVEFHFPIFLFFSDYWFELMLIFFLVEMPDTSDIHGFV